MNTADIKRVIQDQKEEKEKLFTEQKIIEREAGTDKAKKALSHPNIYAILGLRRCGKSVYSQTILQKEKHAYLNFDDETLYGLKTKDLDTVLKAFYELYGTDLQYIILDEIQNIEGWELYANRLRRTKKVIITGSNSKLLTGELATHLTGRHMDFTLYPFSYREYLEYSGTQPEELQKNQYSTTTAAKAEKTLEDYISRGGLPEAHRFGAEMTKTVFSDIVTKDVIRRHHIKNPATIETLAKHLTSNHASEITYSRLKNILDIKKTSTIKNYVTYLQESQLIFTLQRFSYKLKQQTNAPKKVYCIDTGIINAVSFKATESPGRLIENIVAVELQRRKSYWHQKHEIYYWKDHQQKEVDFVIKEGTSIKELIQVCYDISDPDTKTREERALIKAGEDLRCDSLLVLTWDYDSTEEHKGKKIRYAPLWKWLLEEKT